VLRRELEWELGPELDRVGKLQQDLESELEIGMQEIIREVTQKRDSAHSPHQIPLVLVLRLCLDTILRERDEPQNPDAVVLLGMAGNRPVHCMGQIVFVWSDISTTAQQACGDVSPDQL